MNWCPLSQLPAKSLKQSKEVFLHCEKTQPGIFDVAQNHLYWSVYILVGLSRPWSEAPFTLVHLVQTKLKSLKVWTI